MFAANCPTDSLSALVIVIDAVPRTAELHDATGCLVLDALEILSHEALPGFKLSLEHLFASLDNQL